MAYVSYETIDNIPIEEAQNAINGGGDTGVPGISGEKINAKTSAYNLPEQSHIAGWTTDIVRSATDHETIAWTGGDINMPDGTIYNVSAGSVVVNGLTYFYYDMVDEVIKTTTTSADSVGVGKLLILVANDSTPPNKATFTAFGTGQSEQLVTHDYISPGAVDTVNIALGAIESNLIATGAITETKIDDNAITTPKIATGAITANEIGANAVTAVKINAGAVTTAKINSGAITSDKIDAGAVTAVKIASHTITANQIASNTITASEIASNTITANEINTNTINSLDLTSGTITGVTITGGLFRTATSGKRIQITSSGTYQNEITLYNNSGDMSGRIFGGTYFGDKSTNIETTFFSISGKGFSFDGDYSSIDANISGIGFSGNVAEFEMNVVPRYSYTYNLGSSSYRRDTIYTDNINISGSLSGSFSFSGTTNFNSIEASGFITSMAGIQSRGDITPYNANTYKLGSQSYPRREIRLKTSSSGPAGRLFAQVSGSNVNLVRNDGSSNIVLN